MQIAIDMFEEWAKETGLTINTSKTKAMAFTNKGCPTPRLYLNNQEIEAVYKFKYLGITFDAPRLTWGDHIEDLLDSCENSLKLMKAMAFSKYGADRKSLLLLYTSVIRSKILYSSPMLITTCRSNLESLEQIQSKALRIATGALKSSPIVALQCEADIPSINLMIKEHAIKYYYKILTKPNNHPLYEYIYQVLIDPKKDWDWRTRKPFTLKIQETIHEWDLPGNPNLPKRRRKPVLPPWEVIENKIFLDLITPMTKENHTPEQLRAEAIRTIEDRFQNHLQIYTDGSKVAREPPTESSTTAGYYVADINILFTGH